MLVSQFYGGGYSRLEEGYIKIINKLLQLKHLVRMEFVSVESRRSIKQLCKNLDGQDIYEKDEQVNLGRQR